MLPFRTHAGYGSRWGLVTNTGGTHLFLSTTEALPVPAHGNVQSSKRAPSCEDRCAREARGNKPVEV